MAIDREALLNQLEQHLTKAEPAQETVTKTELGVLKEHDVSRILEEKIAKTQESIYHEGTGNKA